MVLMLLGQKATAQIPSPSKPTAEIQVMTLAVRAKSQDEALKIKFDNRWPAINACVTEYLPSILLLQQAEWEQLEAFDNLLKGQYARISEQNLPDLYKSQFTAIYYKSEDFDEVRHGHFWLSETPDESSRGWNGVSLPKDVTWVILNDKFTEREIMVVNVVTERARKCLLHSMPLLQNRIYEICEYKMPVIVGGLVWLSPEDEILNNMHRDYHDAVLDCKSSDKVDTFNDFGSNTNNHMIADHIFYRGFNGVLYQTVTSRYADVKYMSDHYPVLSILEY